MGLSVAMNDSVRGRSWQVATVCALALAVALAQLVALWAWHSGAHVTVEQIALHEEALAHGHADHHGDHTHGHAGHHAPSAAPTQVSGPVFGPALGHAGPYQDVLQGAFVGRPDPLSRVGGARLEASAVLPPAQNFPSVPQRPPIQP
jgi:hypothetical protein